MSNVTYKKLIKPDGDPTELERTIASHLTDLAGSEELKNQINELYFKLEHGNKSCILIWVPYPQLRDFQKCHSKLVRELEKKFSGSHVVILAKRRIIPKPLRGKNRLMEKQKRPRSRTLTAVHEGYLADLVFPAEVVGKRIRIKLDGKQVQKIHLDKAQQTTLEHKVDTFSHVYKTITGGKDVTFEFPDPIY
ncbi:40S ribosomal protein S7 [Aphelenchoides bicaudatus]|nr:40S ribosomal protein S7 [Aphelenchoides bicaudatus]